MHLFFASPLLLVPVQCGREREVLFMNLDDDDEDAKDDDDAFGGRRRAKAALLLRQGVQAGSAN